MRSKWVWIIGGLFVGTGFLFMLGAFGPTGFGFMQEVGGAEVQKHMAEAYSQYGYDASLQIQLTSNGYMALCCFLVGLMMLIGANATAWRDTEGY